MTQERYKRICSRFPKGVTVVTARRPGDGLPVGMTVSAFTGVSLDPPTILICLRQESTTTRMLLEASHFAVNVLGEAQREVSQRFATGDPELRFSGVECEEGPHSVPLLAGTLGHFVCERTNAVVDGDHYVVFGRVLAGGYREDSFPLVYWASNYRSLRLELPLAG
jgi:flavin reductase (DIM6/NTAB) family NADH-FMN oxidoreductase RutF